MKWGNKEIGEGDRDSYARLPGIFAKPVCGNQEVMLRLMREKEIKKKKEIYIK